MVVFVGRCFGVMTILLAMTSMVCHGWSINPGPPTTKPMTVKTTTTTTTSQEILQTNIDDCSSRRNYLKTVGRVMAATTTYMLILEGYTAEPAMASAAKIDVNNALAREYTAFPGLYPTVATKIVNGAKDQPYKSKKDVYAILNELEQERLRQYDSSIVINKPDKALQQFKTSQICKYECGGRASSSFRDEQIKAVQAARR